MKAKVLTLTLLIFAQIFSTMCHLNSEKTTSIATLKISIKDFEENYKEEIGEINISLLGDVVPKTVRNFESLCVGYKGSDLDSQKLTYVNSPFHRIIPNFMI